MRAWFVVIVGAAVLSGEAHAIRCPLPSRPLWQDPDDPSAAVEALARRFSRPHVIDQPYYRPEVGGAVTKYGPIVVTASGDTARELMLARDREAELVWGRDRVKLIKLIQGPIVLDGTPADPGNNWQVVYVPSRPLVEGRTYRLTTHGVRLDWLLAQPAWKVEGWTDPDFTERLAGYQAEFAPGAVVVPVPARKEPEAGRFHISAGRLASWDDVGSASGPTGAQAVVNSAMGGLVLLGVSFAFMGLLALFFRPRRLTWRGGPQLTRAQAREILGRL